MDSEVEGFLGAVREAGWDESMMVAGPQGPRLVILVVLNETYFLESGRVLNLLYLEKRAWEPPVMDLAI